MRHLPYLTFTRLLRDDGRESLGRYAGALASAIVAWHGVAATAVSFRPGDPLQSWRSPDCAPGRWRLFLARTGAPRIVGSLFAEPPDQELDEVADLRGYGDHLIESAVADTARTIDNLSEVRGFASGILLEARLEALSRKLPSPTSPSEKPPYAALIHAVEEALRGGSRSPEILTVTVTRREMRQFLERCDTEILERLGETNFAGVLAPLGLRLKQWRRASPDW